jgi:hypothetical protein
MVLTTSGQTHRKEPPVHRTTRTRRLALGLALPLALLAAACGDDDDTASGATTPPATKVSTEACDALVGLSGALAGDPSAAGPTLEAFESTAPEEVADDATAIVAGYQEMLDGGDPSALGSDEFLAASADVADVYFTGCDTTAELDVAGIDYGFEGLPAELDAGRVAIRFTNATEHDEPHEMVLFRRLPGTDEPVEELLALPEEESMKKLALAGVVFADAPGSQAMSMLDLEAGEYIALCFIPTGGGEDGPPHFLSGMVAELTVS